MQRSCANAWCKKAFSVTDADLAFYERVSPVFAGKKVLLPPPVRCPDCRLLRRAILRNERTLRRATCTACGKRTLSMYAADSPFAAYCHDCWFSDRWDPLSFGQAFDPNRPFFEQFQELSRKVPRIAVLNPINENSDYCNFADWNKNGYMLINSNSNEDSFHSTLLLGSKNCMDCLWTKDSELCYECVNVEKSYGVRHSLDCADCRDSAFLTDCRGCTQCIGCVNLRQKTLCIFNEPVSENVYRETWLTLSSSEGREKFAKEYDAFLAKQPRIALHVQQSEGSTGEHIVRCKNVRESFDIFDCRDCAYCDTVMILSDCYDMHTSVKAELCIENVSFIGYHCGFSAFCRHPKDAWYSWDCHNTTNVFGCIGLKQKTYCILNRQYTKDEYERLVLQIAEKMKEDGEWGQFFPEYLSAFGYNETVADEYEPLSKEDILHRELPWHERHDEQPAVEKIIPGSSVPDTIDETPDDILDWAISCDATGRPFRIIKQELAYYRKHSLPAPHLHPDERHKRRLQKRTARKLFMRTCDNCHKEMTSHYAPGRKEKVLCEECYLREVY
jgi:hypothetical protein